MLILICHVFITHTILHTNGEEVCWRLFFILVQELSVYCWLYLMVVCLVPSEGTPEQFFIPPSSISLQIIWVDSLSYSTLSQTVKLTDSLHAYCSFSVALFTWRQLASSILRRHHEDQDQAAFCLQCCSRAVRSNGCCSWSLQETVWRRGWKACSLSDSYENSPRLLGGSGGKGWAKNGKKR